MKDSIRLRAAVVVLFIATLSVRGFHHPNKVEVATAAVTQGDVVRRIVATGDLEAVTNVQVGTQVSGVIQSINVDYNSIVHAGEVLAVIDPSLFEAALDAARASLARAEAAEMQAEANRDGLDTTLNDARQKFTREQELAIKQIAPPSDLDSARFDMNDAAAALSAGQSQIEEAKAAVEAAKAGVKQASVDVEHTVITAPIDGIVVARSIDVGQTVAATLQAPVLFTLAARLTHMQMEVDIDESDISHVRPGEPATFEVESYPNKTFEGTVTQVRLPPIAEQMTPGPQGPSGSPATPASATIAYAAIVDVANPDESLRPGMTATVMLGGSRRDNVIRIPNTALAFRPSEDVLDAVGQAGDVPSAIHETSNDVARQRVWTFDGTRFSPVEIRVGLVGDQWTEMVGGGLQSGDALVTSASLPIKSLTSNP